MTPASNHTAAGSGGGIEIVRMPAELDLTTSAGVAAQGCAAIARLARLVLLDLTGLSFCDARGLRRARLDTGTLGVVAVRVDSARQAIGLLRRGHSQGLTTLTAKEVTVDADAPQVPVGIDGETVMVPTPVRCVIRPRALRVVLPRTTSRRFRPQVGPGMAAAAAARFLPRPAGGGARLRPARQGAKPRAQ